MKKAKFGTDFQNNRANYWLYEKYSFDLHPEISKNPDKLLWPEITDVAKTDCRNLHEPAMKDKYIDLIEQTFDFPQDEFSVEDNELPPPPLELDKHDAYICGYPDGTVKPERQITRAEVATIFYRLLQDEARENVWSRTNSYSDVASGVWYNSAVSTLTNAGILTGYPDGTFRPDAPITRAEFATIAARFYHAPEVTGDAFSDISGSWAREYINRAAARGLIDGYEDGTFRPNQNIKRDEAMKIINKVLFRTPDKEHFLPDMIKWPDNSNTDAWYYTDVQEATNNHDYERVDKNSPETWTKITQARDWKALEAELAQKYPNR